MLMQEYNQLAQWNVADGAAAEVGHEQVERQLAAVMFFQCFAEDDSIDGSQAQIAEKPRVGTNVPGIFAAIEISQNSGHIGHDLLFGHSRINLLYSIVMAAAHSPSRCCKARRISRWNAAAATLIPGTLVKVTCGNSSTNAPPR